MCGVDGVVGGVVASFVNGVYFEYYNGLDVTPEDGISGTLLSTGYMNNLTNSDDIFLNETGDYYSLILGHFGSHAHPSELVTG